MLVKNLDNVSENKDTIVKNLRTRKVSYLLQKCSDTERNVNPERDDHHSNHQSSGSVSNNKSVKKRNLDVKSGQKTSELKCKNAKYLFDMTDDEIEVNFASPMKRICEDKSRKTAKKNVLTPKQPLSTSLLDGSQIEISVTVATPVKRTYRKQSFELLKSGTRTRQKISNASFADFSTIFQKLTLSDVEPIKKRRYSEPSNKSVYSKSKNQRIREVDGDDSPLKVMTPKRTYKKRTVKSHKSVYSKSKKQPIQEEVRDNSLLKVITPKRTYKRTKKIKPAASMKDQASSVIEGDFSSLSSFSQDSGCITKPMKRPRERPRSKGDPTYVPFSDEDTTSTSCTASSVSSSTSSSSTSTRAKGVRRATAAPRPRPWWMDEEPAPDTLSEYELQRQRNIQQNMQMLRQIFSEKGLEEESELKSCKGRKPRKTYNRHPLPPPRPRSERLLEHSQPLDFSKLFKNDSYFN